MNPLEALTDLIAKTKAWTTNLYGTDESHKIVREIAKRSRRERRYGCKPYAQRVKLRLIQMYKARTVRQSKAHDEKKGITMMDRAFAIALSMSNEKQTAAEAYARYLPELHDAIAKSKGK